MHTREEDVACGRVTQQEACVYATRVSPFIAHISLLPNNYHVDKQRCQISKTSCPK